MTMLKAGNVVGMRVKVKGELLEFRNEDGSPLTFIIEDNNGESHELYLSVGRMGTYSMFVQPPFRVTAEGDFGDPTPMSAAESDESGSTVAPRRVSVTPRRGRSVVQ